MLDISVIILTYNEEIHIKRCVSNAMRFSREIFLVDSYSTDRTVEIAEKMGVKVYQNKWENNYAKQFNWGLDNLPISSNWILRLDADEYLTDELIQELNEKLPSISENVSGLIFPLKRYFLDTYVRRGIGKMNLLRLFRKGQGRCEDRWMDEHIKISSGESVLLNNAFCDHNLNNIGWWTVKHNQYSIREAIDLLNIEIGLFEVSNEEEGLSKDATVKRKGKHHYAKMPLFFRSFVYFLYRYFIKLGFIEGKEAFLWHFLQGWWYRTLVDAKVYEIKKNCGTDINKIREYIKNNYNILLK